MPIFRRTNTFWRWMNSARLEALADGKVTTDAPGMVVQDVTLDLIGRAVRIRIYRPAAWAEGGSDSIGKNAKRGPRSEPRVRISNLSEGLSSTAPHGPSHLHL